MFRTLIAIATFASLSVLAHGEERGVQSKVASPIETLVWQTPDSWIRLVAGDEKETLSPKVLEPELAPPARVTLAPYSTLPPHAPDVVIQPVPDPGVPLKSKGQPNSNLPPQVEESDPDYSEVIESEMTETIESADSFEEGPAAPAVSPELEIGSISDGYWFAPSAGCGESCGETVCGTSFYGCLADEACRVFTVNTGAVFLQRNGPKSQQLIVNPANTFQNLDASDFDFGMQAGIEVAATAHRLFGDMDLDMRFFSVGDFSDQVRRRTTGTMTRLEMARPINVVGPRSIVADYGSDLASFEAGLRYRMGAANDWTTFWFGLRVLDIGESLNGSLASSAIAQATRTVSVDVDNRLFGLQLGMDQTILGDGQHSLEGYWRAGIYGNNSSSSTSLGTQGPVPSVISSTGSAGRPSFVGELGLKGKLRLTSNLSLYGRYQILFAEGIAVAGEQLAATNLIAASGHSANGGLFYHGAVLGLEYAY